MNSHVQAGDPGALLRERLEALVSQLVELEKLRERVGREENRQRELRKAAAPVPSSDCERPLWLRRGKARPCAAWSQ